MTELMENHHLETEMNFQSHFSHKSNCKRCRNQFLLLESYAATGKETTNKLMKTSVTPTYSIFGSKITTDNKQYIQQSNHPVAHLKEFPQRPQVLRSWCLAMKTPAPQTGHSRRRRVTFPLSSTL